MAVAPYGAGEPEAMLAEATNAQAQTSGIVATLQSAAATTGSDFRYLLSTAMRESSLKPQAQSGTSSAVGLFQFVEQTWLGLVKTYGAKYGLSSMANAISQSADGRWHADNAADRQAILALRKDPKVSALMEGEFANQSRSQLESTLGRGVCNGELYAAHFLGPDAACKLIQMSDATPAANAAAAFPQAAGANRSVFYHADGTSRTVREVYAWALKQSDGAMPAGGSDTATPQPFILPADSNNAPIGVNVMLASMTSWTPSRGFFLEGDEAPDQNFPSAPFLLTPAVMDVLSSVGAQRT
jgi:hypothetical protein